MAESLMVRRSSCKRARSRIGLAMSEGSSIADPCTIIKVRVEGKVPSRTNRAAVKQDQGQIQGRPEYLGGQDAEMAHDVSRLS